MNNKKKDNAHVHESLRIAITAIKDNLKREVIFVKQKIMQM